jgi:hypothetical protein
MTQHEFARSVLSHLPHSPTPGTAIMLAEALAKFIFSRSDGRQHLMFLLKGYAGNRKNLHDQLPWLGPYRCREKKPYCWHLPAGQPKYSRNIPASRPFTIHRKIYMHQFMPNGGVRITLRTNQHKNTLFIVDEASMIQSEAAASEQGLFSSRNLLDDLIEYVYSSNCRLLLAGDTAQLPPVGTGRKSRAGCTTLNSFLSFATRYL